MASGSWDDSELVLSGSQVGVKVNSSRHPASRTTAVCQRQISSSKQKNTKAAEKDPTKLAAPPQFGSKSEFRQNGDDLQLDPDDNDDFLSFFENNSAHMKINKQTRDVKSAGKGKSKSEAAYTDGGAGDGKYSHSVFVPMSARSTTSTVNDDNTDQLRLTVTPMRNGRPPAPPSSHITGDNGTALTNRSASALGTSRTSRAADNHVSRVRPSTGAATNNTQCNEGGQFSTAVRRNSFDGGRGGRGKGGGSLGEDGVIANNLTSRGQRASHKTSLQNIENSYQNIKHNKSPLNQLGQAPSLSSLTNQMSSLSESTNQLSALLPKSNTQELQPRFTVAEDYIAKCNMAASQIQRWYLRRRRGREVRGSTSSGTDAVRNLLAAKREQLGGQTVVHGVGFGGVGGEDEERERIRKERARLARQQAIQELHAKREEKKKQNEAFAQQEIKSLQAAGKLSQDRGGASSARHAVNSAHGARKGSVEGGKNVLVRSASIQDTRHIGVLESDCGETMGKKLSAGEPQPPSKSGSISRLDNILSRSTAPEVGDDGVETSCDQTTTTFGTRTTIDELMETLRKLEEEEKFPPSYHNDSTVHQAWMDINSDNVEGDTRRTVRSHAAKDSGRTTNQSNVAARGRDKMAAVEFLSDQKLSSIMSYLDKVESDSRIGDIDQELERVNETLYTPAPLVPSGDQLAHLEQASLAASEVTQQILSQKMELEEKKRLVQMLKKALGQQRELTVRHAKETEGEMRKRLDVQKQEHEEAIKRHLGFIDQLIDDKKSLSEKCEQLVKELKTIDKKYQDKLKALQDSQEIEVQKLKELNAATEKLRREKWIEDKTKKIKEMTVRGLEPEIQRLISQHKLEIKKIKSIHEAELLESDERAGQRYIKMTEELRDQLAREKEAACARERELARQTYEKQLEQEEQLYQQQRQRLYAEVKEEKERNAAAAQRQRAELERLQRQLETSHSSASESLRAEYESGRVEQERRHAAELNQLREQLTTEREAWVENYRQKQETWLMSRERELKEQVKRERDKEIELVIHRLEEDNQASRDECERVAENRIKRIRDKYEGEMSELERSERQMTEKYNQLKAKLSEIEGEYERLKVTMKQKDKDVEELKRLLDKRNEERDHISDVVRQEFVDRLVATDEENKRMKNDMSELKARHRLEVERAKADANLLIQTKEEELEKVHKRVKEAIVKKEEVVMELRKQYDAAVKRADHLEGLLEQQRKQLLGGKK